MGKEPDHEPSGKRPPFTKRVKEAFNSVSRKDWVNILRDTVSDLRKPQEIALLVAGTFLPGGWIGYGIYRVAKYRHKKAANDDHPKPAKEPKPPRPPQPKR